MADDYFEDDGLDTLPDNTIDELEAEAFRLTQQPLDSRQPYRLGGPSSRPIDQALAGDLGQLSVNHEALQVNAPQQPSSDYGDLNEDDMLDGEIVDAAGEPAFPGPSQKERAQQFPDEVTQRERWRLQRHGGVNVPRNAVGGASTRPREASYEGNALRGQPKDLKPENGHQDATAMRAHISQLLDEREALQTAIQTANETTYAKAGEIAIVRANASKIEKEYEGRIKALHQRHSEDTLKQRAEIDKAKADLQKLTTEKGFLENDLAEGTKQIRTLQRALKREDRSGVAASPTKQSVATTPKKGKAALGDGFDQDELLPLSPSKLAMRNRLGTPKATSKRKRKPVDDSPVQSPLELNDSQSFEPGHIADEPHKASHIPPRNPQVFNFSFIQQFLNHQEAHSHEKSIEALTKFHLPSNPAKSLATLLLDALSPARVRPDINHLPSAVALEVISLWSKCMAERYYAPIHLLIDYVSEILTIEPSRTAADLTNDLMSLLQETADIIIIPRCQKKPPRSDSGLITSYACLELLQIMTIQLTASPEESTRIWRTMRFDFIMMLLSFIHPLHELHTTVQILRTSILPQSFTMIIPPGDGKQDASEARVIDNLTRLLVESPRPNAGEPALTPVQLASLRLAILDLTEDMCSNAYATAALYTHRLFLGRLVRLMNDSLVALYRYDASHDLLSSIINTSTRLLYFFLNNFSSKINMQQKLSVIPGGEQKFLIVLTRLAFSEGACLEGGIEDDVTELAHRMLEERISPEEAEQLIRVMSSAPASAEKTDSMES